MLENIHINHNIQSQTFTDSTTTNNCQLSLLIGKNEISSAVIDELTNTVIYLKSYHLQLDSYQLKEDKYFFDYKLLLKDILNQEALFKQKFSKVVVGINVSAVTLVPKQYYQEESLKIYYGFNNKLLDASTNKLFTDTLKQIATTVIYPIDYFISESLYLTFKDFTIKHAASFLIDQILKENQQETEKRMYVNIHKHHCDIVAIEGAKLLLYNNFYYKEPTDLLYFILNTAKHTGVDLTKDECILLGQINTQDEAYLLCKEHITYVVLSKAPTNKSYCEELKKIPTHYHYNLLSI